MFHTRVNIINTLIAFHWWFVFNWRIQIILGLFFTNVASKIRCKTDLRPILQITAKTLPL